MVVRVRSAVPFGIDAIPVEVEVNLRSGLPGFAVVGLPQASVRESRDRVLAAIRNTDLPIPRGAITVNLAPADVRKEGTLFDLPLAIALLAVQERLPREGLLARTMIVGELALDGRVRSCRGALAVARCARETGCSHLIVPADAAGEARLIEGVEVAGVDSLDETVRLITSPEWPSPSMRPAPEASPAERGVDLQDVRGQPLARRALEIAAAGSHSVIFVGPPGVGKSMLARRLPGLLPPLTTDEALEVMQIQSVAGRLSQVSGLRTRRPFEAPHHSVSTAGLIGGGNPPRPGALSLAHRGVLFLDELPEFRRGVLEALREPLEAGQIVLSRARYQLAFPSQCQLVAAMNPCPCGYSGHPVRPCLCDPGSLARYASRVSGPLLDRVDLHVAVGPVDAEAMFGDAPGESSASVRERVLGARRVAAGRRPSEGLHITGASQALLARAMERYGMSARAVERLRRIARTISDLEGGGPISADHMAEGLQFHRPRYRRVA